LLEPDMALDPSSPEILIPEILHALQQKNARILFYDLSRIPIIDTLYYDWLCLLARACAAAAITMTVIRMQPTAACSLAHYITEAPPFGCAMDTEIP
ncbi:hypothetical protein, partial [Desulfobotulus sp.]|uniref:hypothetical protein n=1 Tax=Desulfobotulus sp. TaxID=1940337 RepID=UPI002A371CD7